MSTALPDLLARLRAGGTRLREGREPDVYVLTGWEGEDLATAIELHVPGPAVSDYRDSLRDDAAVLWPDTDTDDGALNLFLVHIEEAVLAREAVVRIDVAPDGLHVTRAG